MFRLHHLLIASLAVFAVLPFGLIAQTDDPEVAVVADEARRGIVAALAEWSGEATALELLVVQDFPDVAAAYVREVEGGLGNLGEYFALNDPATADAFLAETGVEASSASDDFFSFLVTVRPAYARWQAELADTATGLELETFVAARYPVVLLALERANQSPASRGVGLRSFLAQQGYDHLLGPAQSMIDQLKPFDVPPGSCACAVAVDIETSTDGWTEVQDWQSYDGAPLPVIDRAYAVAADGPAHNVYFKRRTKAKDLGDSRKHDGDAMMTLRLECFRGGSDEGLACLSGGCTADLRTQVMYSARAEHFLDAGLGKGTASSANAVRLRYNPGQASEKLLVSHGVATSGEKRTHWDVKGFFENTFLSLVTDFVPEFITPEQAAVLDDIEDDKSTSMVDGVLNIYHIEGTDSSQAYDMKAKSVLDGTMIPNVTYTLELESGSSVSGWGRLHAHTRTYAWVDSSFLMAATARNFVCDSHVSSPPRQVWWRYAAAPEAPQGRDFLRETIRSFALIELGAHLPGNVFAGDSHTAGQGSHQP